MSDCTPKWEQASPSPAMHVQQAYSTSPIGLNSNHGSSCFSLNDGVADLPNNDVATGKNFHLGLLHEAAGQIVMGLQ